MSLLHRDEPPNAGDALAVEGIGSAVNSASIICNTHTILALPL
jgi:hypothetical protein